MVLQTTGRGAIGSIQYHGDEAVEEVNQLLSAVVRNEDDFDAWSALVGRVVELEGGINRNSNPASIEFLRNIFDVFLAKFPLFFGYWKRYADNEFSIGGTEAAEMVYERGVSCVPVSVDLWMNYCQFKMETCHDNDITRALFERGAHFVGLDFQSHPFWDKYLEFEERLGDPENVSKLYRRIFEIPSIQFARYYEKFRARISTRPLEELLEESTLQEITDALRAEFPALAAIDFDRQLRGKVDVHFYEIYQHVQAEVTKRWTFESNIKRSYFLVNDLDEAELENWRKYLDFEEDEGDYRRIAFLYERCVVPTALYEEFWLRYVAWMRRQKKGYSTNEEDFVNGSEEDTRLIFMRASCIFVPLERPHIRFLWARFEESFKRIDTARNIHDAIIEALPGSVEAYVSHVNLERRHSGIQAAIEMCEHYQENCPPDVRCHLLVERARILWECAGDVDGARSLYTTSRHTFPSSTTFWASWLRFECSQHRHGANGSQDQVDRACALMMSNVDLTYPERVSLTDIYLKDLLARGDSEASSKYMNAEKLLHTRTSSVNQKDIPMNGDPPGPVSAEYPPTSV